MKANGWKVWVNDQAERHNITISITTSTHSGVPVYSWCYASERPRQRLNGDDRLRHNHCHTPLAKPIKSLAMPLAMQPAAFVADVVATIASSYRCCFSHQCRCLYRSIPLPPSAVSSLQSWLPLPLTFFQQYAIIGARCLPLIHNVICECHFRCFSVRRQRLEWLGMNWLTLMLVYWYSLMLAHSFSHSGHSLDWLTSIALVTTFQSACLLTCWPTWWLTCLLFMFSDRAWNQWTEQADIRWNQ